LPDSCCQIDIDCI